MDYELNQNLISRIAGFLNIREMVSMHGAMTGRLFGRGFFTPAQHRQMNAIVKKASIRWLKKEKNQPEKE